MKKKIIIALLLLFIILPHTVLAEDYDFRNTNWGMSKEEVVEIETAEYAGEDGDLLFYTDDVAGLDTILFYEYLDNKLVSGGYVFDENYINQNNHIDDYKKVKELLAKKYGEPVIDRQRWLNDLYKGDTQNYGTALSVGHLAYMSKWEAESTDITMMLRGENFEVNLTLYYKSKEYSSVKEKADEEEDMEGL